MQSSKQLQRSVQWPLHLAVLLSALAISFNFPQPALAQPRSPYDGASVVFDEACLIKPRENTNLGLALALAPMIVQESPDTSASVGPAEVFFSFGANDLNGFERAQVTYWWFYDSSSRASDHKRRNRAGREPVFKGGSAGLMNPPSPLRAAGSFSNQSAPPRVQGIRMTLDTNGVPIIYEVLGQCAGLRQIYLTQSVEAAARAAFGSALPGRRHSAERSLDEAPGVIVPRVIDDPPAVMGPMLYLRAGTHEVATLICRCMAAQVRTLSGTAIFELRPAISPPADAISAAGLRLEDVLRLPSPSPGAVRE